MSGKRWLIGAPIVAFWLVMTGLLMRDELGTRALDAEADVLHRPREPTESWLGLSLADGRRVGYVHLRQAPEERHELPGSAMTLEARMRLVMLGKSTELELEGSVWRPDGDARIELWFAVRSAGHDFDVSAEVADGELRGEVTSAGESLPLRLPVDDGLVFSSGFGAALRFPRLGVGDAVWIDSFDPLTLARSRARVECQAREVLRLAGDEISTCRLKVTSGGLTSFAWIDDQGEVARAETPVGLVLERTSPGTARAALLGAGDAADLAGHTAIRPTGRRPFRGARTMTVTLGGLADLALPEDRVQSALGGGRYRLSVPPEPVAGPGSETVAPAEHLAADTFVQSDHEKIRRRAAAIVGAETDPWRRALAIHDWVFTRLEKEVVISIPSALEVLARRRGDCNEHTVLFAALARAADLPTRIAVGIVWSDELDGFYYHAWPEVLLGDWVWMDPTLGQPLADATHLKLANGGIESWPRLLPYLGRLEIEVTDVE